MQELSMGMSEDYALALEANATMIRLGRVLFGEREVFSRINCSVSEMPLKHL